MRNQRIGSRGSSWPTRHDVTQNRESNRIGERDDESEFGGYENRFAPADLHQRSEYVMPVESRKNRSDVLGYLSALTHRIFQKESVIDRMAAEGGPERIQRKATINPQYAADTGQFESEPQLDGWKIGDDDDDE